MNVKIHIKILLLPSKRKNYIEINKNFTNVGPFRNEFMGTFGHPIHSNKYLVDIDY
jgi:hypothetical protein